MITGTSIQECFTIQVGRTPNAIAVSCGNVRLSYGELNERANQLAHRLQALGVGPGSLAAVLMERSVDVVVALLAVVKTGGCYLPLHSAYPAPRMRWILEQAGEPVLVTDEVMRARGLPLPMRPGATSPAVVMVTDPELVTLPVSDPGVAGDPDQVAYLMYTSGSTGHPKGVEVTHRNLLDLVFDRCWDGDRHRRSLMVAPYAFSVSAYEVWVPLLHGDQIVVAPPGDLDVATLGRLLTEKRITDVHLTAGLFRTVAEQDPQCLRGTRRVLTGGDVITPAAVRRVLRSCPDTQVRAMYGATETTLFTVSAPVTAPGAIGASVPVGRAMDQVRCYLLDEHLRPVRDGAVGELYVAGPRLARGYFGRPDLTAERFVADPFGAPGTRMYRTGDLARWTVDGLVDLVGRADDMVKIRGFRVELAEVDRAVASYPGLSDVAVVARQVEPGDRRLVAYVVPRSADTDLTGLRAHAMARLPEYMVPSAFVSLDALPLTPNGKLDRAALPGPDLTSLSTYRAPRDTVEKVLCDVFAEVLGVSRVGIDDNFFELGGQSLLAMRLIGRIRSELGVAPSIGDLLDAPTVADLAGPGGDAGGDPGGGSPPPPAAGAALAGQVGNAIERVR